jgi:hypothetical protein
MDWVSVSSETVDQIAYEAPNNELHVRFLGGRHYAYSNVPESVYQSFLAAPSKGRFVHAVLKDGPYPCRRIA